MNAQVTQLVSDRIQIQTQPECGTWTLTSYTALQMRLLLISASMCRGPSPKNTVAIWDVQVVQRAQPPHMDGSVSAHSPKYSPQILPTPWTSGGSWPLSVKLRELGEVYLRGWEGELNSGHWDWNPKYICCVPVGQEPNYSKLHL